MIQNNFGLPSIPSISFPRLISMISSITSYRAHKSIPCFCVCTYDSVVGTYIWKYYRNERKNNPLQIRTSTSIFEWLLQLRIKILFPNISLAKIWRKWLISIKKCTKEPLRVMNIIQILKPKNQGRTQDLKLKRAKL